jgi:hypothetical protein
MWPWLRQLWHDPIAFKGAVRSLALGLAIASTTAAGAKIMDGKSDKITHNQWIRFFIAVGAGAAGGAITSARRET